MSKTPTKSHENSYSFIPKEITTPNKDSPGISKTVHTHISNLHNLLCNWEKIKENGTKICKSISALKLYECTDEYFPHQVGPLISSLSEAYDALQNIVQGVHLIKKQLHALSELETSGQGVIFTWSVGQIADNVSDIYNALQKEIKLKQVITENLAHCRDESLIEVYVSSWELEAYYNSELSAFLFADIGLPWIT
ncbi:cyclin-dependent kinase 2-interacting protein-like [Colias croceus]|uniref:cyclin-dependent kinase 2-interacting protein-like n=1 Tax=Colias crocea TaxID=72248 RepID=UPI001E280AA0|nr:cyclin-dependent kinase 2-interacting protein-like [Colias croceus]